MGGHRWREASGRSNGVGALLHVPPRPEGPEATATRLVRSVIASWNRADPVGLRAAFHLPHVSLPGPRLSIRESEQALRESADFKAMASVGGWHNSRLERLEVRQSTEDKVHCSARFAKSDHIGRHYADGHAVYVVTNRQGRWGIQLSSLTLTPLGIGGADDGRAVAAAAGVLRRWIEACDAGDASAVRRLVHLPVVELDGVRLLVHGTTTALRRSVARRAGVGDGHRSRIVAIHVKERSPHKVTFEAEVARVDEHEEMVGWGAILAIVTEQQGRWALRAHSSLLTISSGYPSS